jgi:hypothetical protein
MNKHVFEKIAKLEKTELSEVKVDLALVDDIQKAFISSQKELTRAEAEKKKIIAAIDAVKTSYRQNAIQSQQVLEMYKTFETQAKNLGVEVPANVAKFKADAEAAIKASTEKITSLQNVVKNL